MLSLGILTFAQAPEGINYQASARDANGDLITGTILAVRATVLSGVGGATQVYQETHSATTNDYGLFSIKIGRGAPVSGTFSSIDWGADEYHVQIEVDADGNGYVDMGKTQMMSVPYALYAKTSGSAGATTLDGLTDVNVSGVTTNQILSWNGTEWVPITTSGGTVYNAGSGLTLTGTTFSNTAPDQTVTLSGSGATAVSGTYPNFTITSTDNNTTYSAGSGISLSGNTFSNSAPDQTVSMSSGTGINVTGTYPNFTASATNTTAIWNASQLRGRNVATTTPTSGQVLKWNGSSWAPAADAGGTSYTSGTGINISGSTINALNTTALWNASQLRGRNVATTTPTSGQVLKWNGSSWAPAADAGGTSYTGGTGISISGSTINANHTFAMWNASQLRGRNVATTTPTSGQVLKWNGASWAPAADASGTSPWTISGANIYRSTGNVGIGTTSPGSRLDLVGVANSDGAEVLEVTATGGSGAGDLYYGISTSISGTAGNNAGIETQSNGNSTGWNYGIRGNASNGVQNRGLQGIASGNADFNLGTIGFAFDPNTTGQNIGAYGSADSSSTANYGIRGYADAQNGATGYGVYGSVGTGAGTLYAGYFSGDVEVTGTFNNPSDRRLKSNIVPLNNSLDKLKALNVYSYRFDPKGEYRHMNLPKGKQYGFIAQEIETVFPELVRDNKVPSTNEIGEKDQNGNDKLDESNATYKSVNNISLIPILTKAIQEQQQMIERLEQRIAELENK